jgi:hypothetical protein
MTPPSSEPNLLPTDPAVPSEDLLHTTREHPANYYLLAAWSTAPPSIPQSDPRLQTLLELMAPPSGCSTLVVEGHAMLANPEGVAFAFASGADELAFRLPIEAQDLAASFDGSRVSAYGRGWISFRPVDPAQPVEQQVGDLRFWCETALEYANQTPLAVFEHPEPRRQARYWEEPLGGEWDQEIAAVVEALVQDPVWIGRLLHHRHNGMLAGLARRMATLARRRHDPQDVRRAIAAIGLAISSTPDYRDDLMQMVLVWHSALALGLDATTEFLAVADRLGEAHGGKWLRSWTERTPQNQSLEVFYYEVEDTDGFRYEFRDRPLRSSANPSTPS